MYNEIGDKMLQVKNVTKYYDTLKAVDDLSFEVKEGEIFGLLGLNGAGKTTTFRMIMGLIDDYTGEITLNGKKISYDITDQIGFLTEERSLLTKLTVLEQVKFYGILKGMNEDLIEEELDKLLKILNIYEYKNKKIKELSKGNQQKIQLITAIIHKPKLLILDEPFSGLDPINVELFKKLILDLKKKGTMIIFSSHRMEHVELFCEKLVILVKGRAILSGYLKDIKKDFGQKVITIAGDIDEDEVAKQDGVISVEKIKDEYKVNIKADDYTKNIFKFISKYDNITKFTVEDPSLNEIFVSIVGEQYEN